MTHASYLRLTAFGFLGLLSLTVVTGQQPAPPASVPFTAAQAQAGRDAYARECASCHRPDLRGSGEAPALVGANFMSAWGDLTPADLFTRVRGSMPPGA